MSSLLRRSFVLLLVLASGAGLLVFGAFGLVGALQDAEVRAAQDARRVAVAIAEAVRRDALSSLLHADVDPVRQFELEAGADRLIRGPEFTEPTERAPSEGAVIAESELPVDTQRGLARARSIAASEPAQAVEVLRGLAARDEANTACLLTQAAWFAHRAGDRVGCRECLEGAIHSAPDPLPVSVAAGFTLLAATYERPIADAWIDRLACVDEELGNHLVTRLRELGAGDAASHLGRSLHRVQEIRATAREASAWLLNGGANESTPTLTRGLVDPDRFVAWNPDTRAGVVAGPDWLSAQIERALDEQGVRGEFAVGRGSMSEMEVEVIPGHSVVWIDVDDDASRAGMIGAGSILLALAVCFVAGLIAMFRAVRAETKAARAHSEFLQSVTHELKTPLASIRLLAERLESGRVDSGRTRDYHGMLADEATRLSVLIDNVLDLGRIERGERAYDRRNHELASIVEEAVDVFAPLAQRDGIALEVDVGAATGSVVAVDRGAIVQALLNVLENARKYAREGRRVVVRAAVLGDVVDLDVRDFGPGIAAAERELVFERFRRGEREQSGSISGVGLGLHLSRSIVRAHGGSMVCLAPDDGGAGVTFRMQLKVVDPSEAEEEIAS